MPSTVYHAARDDGGAPPEAVPTASAAAGAGRPSTMAIQACKSASSPLSCVRKRTLVGSNGPASTSRCLVFSSSARRSASQAVRSTSAALAARSRHQASTRSRTAVSCWPNRKKGGSCALRQLRRGKVASASRWGTYSVEFAVRHEEQLVLAKRLRVHLVQAQHERLEGLSAVCGRRACVADQHHGGQCLATEWRTALARRRTRY